MKFRQIALQLFKRKLISASISSLLFSIVTIILFSFPFDRSNSMTPIEFIGAILFICLFAAPMLLIYGIGTSFLSEFITFKLEQNGVLKEPKWRIVLLAILHGGFGSVIFPLGTIAATIFFLTDLWLSRHENYTWTHVLMTCLLPFIFLKFLIISS